jgi:hypothetical protein
MRKTFFICLLLLVLTSCVSPYQESVGHVTIAPPTITSHPTPIPPTSRPVLEPKLVVRDFLPSDENFQNPERGFSSEADFGDSDYSQYYEDGNTLVYFTFRLDDYINSELPQTFLDDMDSQFALIRKGGVKAVVRFEYNDGPYPFSMPDADLDHILLHIQQLSPYLKKNADVIAWLEAGFIGAWGEWHSSTNGLDKDPEAKKKVLFALLDAIPSDRNVLLRYPVDIISNFPSPLRLENAFNGSYQSRVGFHNDCFLASDNDQHTYARAGVHTYEEELDYLASSTQFVHVGGESCEYNPPRTDCPTAINEMQLLHFDEISDGWYPQVLDAWTKQGCYAKIEKRLGYRLSLAKVSANEIVRPGGVLSLEVEVNNTGFSPIKNPRPVYLVLEGPGNFQSLLPVDPRLWLPGETSVFNVRLRIPASAPEGEYKIALWLPDAYPSLQDNSRYSVRFANDGVWQEKSGYNVVSNITVSSLAPGDVDVNADRFIVLP